MKSLLALPLVLLVIPAFDARAQYVFLDRNGDQQCTAADSLQQGENQVDVYFHTSQNADGSAATCATGSEALNMISYEFVLHAFGTGSITYGAYTNHMTEFTVSFGVHQGGRDYHTGFGAPFPLSRPPGLYRVGTLTVNAAGEAGVVLSVSTPLGVGYWTSFGSHCPGVEFNATIRYGVDFQDACGTALPPEPDPGPSAAESFYVPQRGPVLAPIEGAGAIQMFRTCPNNDIGTVLPDNARLKIIVRDAARRPLGGVPAADICILLNGGTEAQGFSGAGADSIVANSMWNPAAKCPDVRCIPADAPTDAEGVTYITLAGSTPGSPGVATRDPGRKWGHYDSDIPVTVQGVPIQGRWSSDIADARYYLHIKSADVAGGLGAETNQGEVVNMLDFNAIANNIGVINVLTWWRDLDSRNGVGAEDFNILVGHLHHDCDTPLDP